MNTQQLLMMEPGLVMDELITSILRQVEKEIMHQAWSTDRLAALHLRDHIASLGLDISSTKLGMSPDELREYCSIQNSENENENVATTSSSITESMCRAFLLYHYKFYGDDIESAKNTAKRSPAKIYQMPTRGR